MPAKQLKKMAKKAGKSFKKAEKYWNEAIAGAKKGAKDKYAYAMGIVKKRLGLSDADLMLNVGVDPSVLLESAVVDVDVKRTRLAEDEDKWLIAVFLHEMVEVDKGNGSHLVAFDDDAFVLQEEFTNLLTEKQSEGQAMEYWRKILLNCPELFIRYIAQATSD